MHTIKYIFKRSIIVHLHRKMSSFKQIRNPITGRSEWEPQCEDYDYHQEIARAAFADMLHDTERNQKYFAALKIAIDIVHKRGDRARVLDIGTGTGILSMMAVQCGADTVTACEAFRPMADCAEKIIERNGMRDHIRLIKKRSTEIRIGQDADMKQRANILVTEVFDTELIGEGAIGIFNHAHRELLEKECIVVPDSATMYAQVVECPMAWSWNKPKSLANLDGEVLLNTPKEIIACRGSTSLHDIQLNQFPQHLFNSIVDPIPVLDFDWSGKSTIPIKNSNNIHVKAARSGTAHVVFMWWDLKMDQIGDIILSCAPYWAHPDYDTLRKMNQLQIPQQNVIPWRDHWMQALYYTPSECRVQSGDALQLHFNHDEYSLFFDISKMSTSSSDTVEKVLSPPLCECGFHIVNSRTRIGQLNDNHRNKKYLNLLENEINSQSIILALSDCSMLALACSALGAKHVYCLETNRHARHVQSMYVKANNLKNVELLENLDDFNQFANVTHVFGEPNFISSILPWDNFYFGTLLSGICSKLANNVKIIPKQAIIYAIPVEFLDLHKIRAPLGQCEGFDLNIFDRFVESSSDLADAIVEAQPLWEYPCRALTQQQPILTIDFSNFTETKQQCTTFKFPDSVQCNGIALWVDWKLNDSDSIKYTITTGPSTSICIGEFIEWDFHTRQGVHLLPRPKTLQNDSELQCDISFVPENGSLTFKFDFK